MRVALLGRYHSRDLFDERIRKVGDPLYSFITLANGLASHTGIEVHLIMCNEAVDTQRVVDYRGMTVHLIPGLPEKWCAATLHQLNARRIHRLLGSLQPDIVHGDHSGLYAYAAVTSSFPNIITLRGIYSEIKRVLRHKKIFTRWELLSCMELKTISKAKALIAINPHVEFFVQGKFAGRIFPIENPLDDSFFAPVSQTRRDQFLFLGTLYPLKGVHDLLAAYKRYVSEGGNATLLIGGPEHTSYREYHAQLRSFADSNNLSASVRFAGPLGRGEIVAALDQSRCLVLPSYQDTAPMVIAEAMARGVPVLSTTVGGIPHLVSNGLTGVLVTPGDVAALANGMKRISSDDHMWENFSRNARNEATRRFAVTNVVAKTIEAYRTVLGDTI